jgi:23S rRNA maturation-related 3'-5' exoribonuclease YhaM
VLEDLPELTHIRDEELRHKAVEAWAYALAETDFPRISAIPGEATPGVFALKRGSQAVHLRSVARISIAIADEFAQEFPEAIVDRDIVLAGALLHDVGKAWSLIPSTADDGKQTSRRPVRPHCAIRSTAPTSASQCGYPKKSRTSHSAIPTRAT